MNYYKIIILFSIVVTLIASCSAQKIPPPQKPPKPAKIAVVLGAGATRGFAHIGVLKILETHKVPIHMIVGTSAGSFVGSLYAFGYNAYALQSMALSLEKNDVVDMAMPDNGFIKGEKLEHYVNTALKNANLETLRIPFYAVATDIRNGKEVIFGKGNSGIAVRSSCSVPGVFRPVKIADRFYVDGGLVSPIAVDAARKYGADIVIAVDVSSPLESFVPETTIETILQSVDIMYSKISESQLQKADVIIRPLVGNFGSADFTRRHEAILEGEKAAIKALPAINQILSKLRHEGRL